MRIVKERKILFGLSCCYTRKSEEVIANEEYFDYMISQGAKFAWFFLFMPVRISSTPELMVTPEQRKHVFQQITKFRKEKPLFTLDFWNDGKVAGGCIAGARSYLHINANGDIEPYAFIHYSGSNIYEKTLAEGCEKSISCKIIEP